MTELCLPPLAAGEAELSDGARTLGYVTAASIIKAAEHLPRRPKTWVLCGGGRHNSVIVEDIKQLAAEQGAEVRLADELDLSGDMLEAQAFGYLAVRNLMDLPLTFPTTTGCRAPVSGGVLARAK